MARISGVDLPRNKKIEFALQYIYGIGAFKAKAILESSSVDPDIRVNKLSEEEITRNIKRLMDIGTYRGSRHKKGLPARGQNTKNNSRTRKGKKKTVAGKKKAV